MDNNNTDNHDADPSPADFLAFTPWACRQYQLDCFPIITEARIEEDDKKKARISGSQIETDQEGIKSPDDLSSIVNIVAVFNNDDNLIQLKFHNNIAIPRKLFRLIYLIIQFYKDLTGIYIDKGLNQESLYDLNKVITASQITEVILDNSRIKQANYYILLENTHLRYLSLARCNLNDDVVEELASRLVYPLTGSKSLSVLILSTNKITDKGAEHIGTMLRTNRQLAYLNLSDNKITDTGADSILNSLIEFRLTVDEKIDLRRRRFTFFTARNIFIKEAVQKITATNVKKISNLTAKRGKTSQAGQKNRALSIVNTNAVEANAKKLFGEFQELFGPEDVVVRDKVTYCLGNNTLCFISLAYNDISYFTVMKLLTVLTTQSDLNRTPRGLVKVNIEGNNIPDCSELLAIDSIIDANLSAPLDSQSKGKTKVTKKK